MEKHLGLHELLDDFKERLLIDYASRDDDLSQMLYESEAEIERLVGSKDLKHQSVRSLVMGRARYVFHGQEEFFYDNYQKDILGLSLEFYKGDKNDKNED